MIEGAEVVSSRGAVAANPPAAARIGAQVLEDGGNAMDAAVATSMACCMLRPNQTGIGGYVCAAVVHDAKTGVVWSVDANGVAPGCRSPDDVSRAGVGWKLSHRRLERVGIQPFGRGLTPTCSVRWPSPCRG